VVAGQSFWPKSSSSSRTLDLPLDDNRNGWSAILPERQPQPALSGRHQADWLVVGAGYAGLAFARRVAEHRPSDHVILIDAGVAGDNASGRNSGFVIDLPHSVGSSVAELRTAQNYKRLLQSGTADLKELVSRYGIDCDWRARGKYHCAAGARLSSAMQDYVRELDVLGEPYELLDRTALSQRLGTAYYQTGIYSPSCVLLNPAALCRGLADHLPANVRLFERTPALKLDLGAKPGARTPDGEVTASRVMIATNGCAAQLPGFTNRLVGLATYATLTRPLSPEQRRRIGDPQDWGLTPVTAVAGATLRYTRDHRFLIRQHVKHVPRFANSKLETSRRLPQHRALLLQRFPQLHDVEFEHTWSGLISFTRNGAPLWGRLASQVYAAVGCNGAGISKQSVAGSTLADLACGLDNPLIADMAALGRPSYLPPRPLLDLGVNAYLARERRVGRGEA
jgi:glycine/D-amino acid oxidase-like deaminating enzyme